MKTNIKFLIGLFILLLPILTFSNSISKEDPKIKIIEIKKELSFYLNKKGEVYAEMEISQLAESTSALPVKFRRYVYFDNNTQIKNIKGKAGGKKSYKVQPIISDQESDGIFHSDLKLCYFDKTLNRKGDQVGFTYKKVFTDIKYLNTLYFNDVYPVEKSSIVVNVPEWLNLDLREINFKEGVPKKQMTPEKKKNVFSFNMTNLTSLSEFKNTPSRSKIDPHMIPIVSSIKVKGNEISMFKDVNDLYGWYAQLVDNIGNDNNGLTSLVEELTAGKNTDIEKIKSIFYWVQDNIRYIAFENGIMGFQPENCQTVLGNKYGDCKGMANLTKEMLLIAGYDARLTWLGTRDLPYTYEIPSLVVDNHMICTVIVDGEKIFLDPTEKYSDLYNYALRIQGKEVLIENGKEFIVEKIPEFPMNHSQEIININLTLEGDQIKGNGNTKFTGNKKSEMYYYLANTPSNKKELFFQNYITNKDKNIKIEIKEIPTNESREKNIEIDYSVELNNRIIDLGKELYIGIELDFAFNNYDIEEDRTRAFEFSRKTAIEGETTLVLPAGMSIKYLPSPVEIDNKDYKFQLKYISKEDPKNPGSTQLHYLKSIEIKNEILLPEQFQDWNEAIAKVKEFYGDQIILQKK
ncbi:MAG: transglutaminase domain-containing protein [Saprospiraceae bacterium]